jgi:hypothetical protein
MASNAVREALPPATVRICGVGDTYDGKMEAMTQGIWPCRKKLAATVRQA